MFVKEIGSDNASVQHAQRRAINATWPEPRADGDDDEPTVSPGRWGFSPRPSVAVAVAVAVAAATAPAPRPPAAFTAATPAPGLSRYSASTGARIERLATFNPSAFTNNGLAQAPDGSAVYFTLIARRPGRPFAPRLMRVDVATRRQAFVAYGWQPAVSNDGAELAYGAVPGGLAIRDVASGRTRTIALVRQLGAAADLLDSSITWLADGTDVAVVASSPAIALDAGRPTPLPASGTCGPVATGWAIVFVHVPPVPAPLSARCVRTPRLEPRPSVLGSSPAAPRSLLFATDPRGRTVVERIAPNGSITRVAAFEDSLPMAIDRSGTHLLFLLGHSPPALWEATLGRGHLTDRRRLFADSRVGPIAW